VIYSAADYKRSLPEVLRQVSEGRSEFRRDYGRLIHSPAFRRLQGKTQLFPGHESDFFRNRLTHSLEVAQVAKGIALQINATEPAFKANPIDTDLVEFASLAHDLGHPPFGHNGEKALDDCMKLYGGFEGNAQTLRLLATVEKKVLQAGANGGNGDYCGIMPNGKDVRLGLNLTYRTLASILKYDKKIPLKRAPTAKLQKGYYASEALIVERVKKSVGAPPAGKSFKTVECQIMDLADDIAYSTYDLEDAMKAGFAHPLAIRAALTNDKPLRDRIYKKVREAIPDATEKEVFRTLQLRFELSSEDRDQVPSGALGMFDLTWSNLIASQGYLRADFSSSLVGGYLKAIKISVAGRGKERFSKVTLDRPLHMEIEALKHLNYESMIMASRLKVVEYRGYELVQTIFNTLSSDAGYLLLPEDCRLMYTRLKRLAEKKRLICDFVSGMTDRYAVEFYGRLKGHGASIFKPL